MFNKRQKLILDCLTNPKIELTPFDKANVILSLEDDNFKINCLTNPNIVLDFSDKSEYAISLIDILLSLKNDKSKISCLTNPDITLSAFEKARIIVSLENEKVELTVWITIILLYNLQIKQW